MFDYLTYIVLAVSVTVATIVDLKTGDIKNWITIPLWLSGFVISFYYGGWSGLGSAFGASLLVVVTTFRIAQPGGGDIKLAMAVGAWIGIGGWPAYIVGAMLTMILLNLIIRLKYYGPKYFLKGLWGEIRVNEQPLMGHKNFTAFQKAGEKAGRADGQATMPGALWITGGVATYIIFSLIG